MWREFARYVKRHAFHKIWLGGFNPPKTLGGGTYNADFCLFMENWMNKLAALQSGSINQEQFETWKRETLEYYSDSYFSDFISQRAKNRNSKGKQKKADYSTIQIISTQEEQDNNE